MAAGGAQNAARDDGVAPSSATVYRRSDSVATRVIAGETLVVPFRGTLASLEQIFALNPVAAFIWNRIDGEAPLGSILAEVVAQFDVGPERARVDLEELIASLHAADLVHEAGGGPGATPQP